MALYIAAHKEFAVQEMPGYIPLHVGAAGGKDLPYQKDNTGLPHIDVTEVTSLTATSVEKIDKEKEDEPKE